MYLELIFMGGAVILAIAVLLCSKFVRAVCGEAIFHPRHNCEIKVSDDTVSITRDEARNGVLRHD